MNNEKLNKKRLMIFITRMLANENIFILEMYRRLLEKNMEYLINKYGSITLYDVLIHMILDDGGEFRCDPTFSIPILDKDGSTYGYNKNSGFKAEIVEIQNEAEYYISKNLKSYYSLRISEPVELVESKS